MTTRIAIAAAFTLVAMGCKGKGGQDDDSTTDVVQEPDAVDDASDAMDASDVPAEDAEADAPVATVSRALLVDSDLLHHSAWLDLHDAARAASIDLTYRRFFPHVTAQDVQGEDAYDMIIVGGGGAPGMAGSRLSFDEVDEMASFVQDGGILVLLAQPTRIDATYAENDWFVMTRVLERLESSMRIERGSLIGPMYLGDPDPPHTDTSFGYATLLEFDMGYAFAFVNDETTLASVVDGPLPAGRATVLRTHGGDVEVFLTSTPGANLWYRTYGTSQVRSITDQRPVAGIERVGEGVLAVAPRYLVTHTGAGGQISEHPALSTSRMTRNTDAVHWLVQRLKDVREGTDELTPTDPTGGEDRVFWSQAPGLPATGEGDVMEILLAPNRREVPASLPEGELSEAFPDSDPSDPPPTVPLFAAEKGRIGYGGMGWDAGAAATVFTEASSMGLDALIGTFVPERLVTGELSTEDADAMRAKMAELADVAGDSSARWLVGSYYTGHVYNRDPDSFPSSIGAQNQAYATPLLYQPLWDDFLIPAGEEVASISADHPGIAGILIDMEMYGSVLTYTDAQAFDDTTFMAYVDTVTDTELHDTLAALPVLVRLDVLVESGLLGDYIRTLESQAEAIGNRYRDAVRALDADFVIALYFPGYPTAWQYRGLVRGLGSADNPVILLTYDPWSHPARADAVAGGNHQVHLGGPIVSHFPPDDLVTTLDSCDTYTDGFWYFSHDEISATGSGDLTHGTRAEYRTAIATADE